MIIGQDEKTEIKMGGQSRCSVSADENKIFTIQAAKQMMLQTLQIYASYADLWIIEASG